MVKHHNLKRCEINRTRAKKTHKTKPHSRHESENVSVWCCNKLEFYAYVLFGYVFKSPKRMAECNFSVGDFFFYPFVFISINVLRRFELNSLIWKCVATCHTFFSFAEDGRLIDVLLKINLGVCSAFFHWKCEEFRILINTTITKLISRFHLNGLLSMPNDVKLFFFYFFFFFH